MLLEQYYQTASKNLKRFLMKSNIRITIFLGIQIVRNHIPKNLDNRSNVDSIAPHKDCFLLTSTYLAFLRF